MKQIAYAFVIILLAIISPVKIIAADVVINEFSAHSSPEWVEFYNASASADYLKNYYIDDDTSFTDDIGSDKEPLTNLVTTNSTYPYINLSTFLNDGGDYVVLFDSAGNIIDQYQYTEDPGSGVTIGRNPNGSGNFTVLVSATKGAENSGAPTSTVTPTPSPTLTPTPAPTSAPTNTSAPTSTRPPTATPTKKPTATATPTSTPTPTTEASPSGEVLAATPEPTPEATPSSNNLRPIIISLLFIGIGLALLALVLVLRNVQLREAIFKLFKKQ